MWRRPEGHDPRLMLERLSVDYGKKSTLSFTERVSAWRLFFFCLGF